MYAGPAGARGETLHTEFGLARANDRHAPAGRPVSARAAARAKGVGLAVSRTGRLPVRTLLQPAGEHQSLAARDEHLVRHRGRVEDDQRAG